MILLCVKYRFTHKSGGGAGGKANSIYNTGAICYLDVDMDFS